jgi:nucleoside phosphorylase
MNSDYMAQPFLCHNYTVGWLCSLDIELAAALAMLDQDHAHPKDFDYTKSRKSLYRFGRVGEHDVVIACLPSGQTGTTQAATVASRMMSDFPSITYRLMVGIGGGVPSNDSDIRLGDVVVSTRVIDHNHGKITAHGFEHGHGSLNLPLQELLEAVNHVGAERDLGRSRFSEYITKLSQLPLFSREAAGSDILFKADYHHVEGATCENCNQDGTVIKRKHRTQNVMVHCGTIASGNQVVKNAIERDEISKKFKGVLCFEMEAAGLMNDFAFLIVRGISDYADSHKNDTWRSYAAGTAAAYAKDLLRVIPPLKGPKFQGSEAITTNRNSGDLIILPSHSPRRAGNPEIQIH